MNELKLEVFPSKNRVMETSFHIYDLVSSNLEENPFKVIRGACRKLANCNGNIGVFENGKQIISTDEIHNISEDVDFELRYAGYHALPVSKNRRVYEEYIQYLISENLSGVTVMGKYRKYSRNSGITTSWFPSSKGGYTIYECRDKSIRLERSYNIRIEIRDDEIAYLWLNTRSLFSSKLSLMDMIANGKDVCGLSVKNDWARFRQSGVVTEISEKTVTDLLDFGCSLKGYYIDRKKEAYRVEGLPDNTPVVLVDLDRGGASLPYYPQALKPIITREYMTKYDNEFSVRIDNLVKRTMATRLLTDKELIEDIGSLSDLGDLSFESKCCAAKQLGYAYGYVKLPNLICGNKKILKTGDEYRVFNYGFYQKPDHKIKVGYLYPHGEFELLKRVANDIVDFAANGKYHGSDDKYIKKGLIDLQVKPIISLEYDVGNITDYKRAANKLKNTEDIDFFFE